MAKKKQDMGVICKRLTEIRGMVKPEKRPPHNLMDRVNTPMREKIREISTLTPKTFRRIRQKERGNKHRPLKKFQYAASMVTIMVRLCKANKLYMPTEEEMPVPVEINSAAQGWNLDQFSSDRTDLKPESRGSIGIDLQRYLTSQSDLRNNQHIKRILYVVRSTNAFTMFSSDMDEELARCLAYERYDHGRVMAYQGRPPERLYYIISGRVALMRQYKLETGHFTKCVGILTKGQFTEIEELEKQWYRQHNLVCKGSVEVLLLEKKDYFFLLNTHSGPPVDFLRTQFLFKEFPCELFLQHPEFIECKYYGPNKLVVADSNDTKHLCIIKSGKCICTRKQNVVDIRNDKAFSPKKAIDKLGYIRASSHADAMMDAHMKKCVDRGMKRFDHEARAYTGSKIVRTMNAHAATLNLPDVAHDSNEYINGIGPKSSDYLNCLTRKGDKFSLKESDLRKHVECTRRRSRFNSVAFSMQAEHLPPPLALINMRERDIDEYTKYNERRKTYMHLDLPQHAQGEDGYSSHRNRLRHGFHVSQQKKIFLGLDTLISGDMFGFNNLSTTGKQGPCGVCIVSEGAEVIMINKRFFRNHAGTVTMLKLETMVREFMDEDIASAHLTNQEMWKQYKGVLMNKMVVAARKDHLQNRRNPNTMQTF